MNVINTICAKNLGKWDNEVVLRGGRLRGDIFLLRPPLPGRDRRPVPNFVPPSHVLIVLIFAPECRVLIRGRGGGGLRRELSIITFT